MKEEKILKSELKTSNILLLIFGGVLFTFIGIQRSVSAQNNYAIIFISIPFLFFGLVCIYHLIGYNLITITKNKLIIKNLIGLTKKTINLKEILSYNEIEKENMSSGVAHKKWKDLSLFGEDFVYVISSSNYKNYDELKRELIRGKKRNVESENEWYRKNEFYKGIGFLIFGIITFIWFGMNSKDLNEKLLSIVFSSLFLIYGIYLIRKNKKVHK